MAASAIGPTRTCTKCGIEKPADRKHFSRDLRVRDGCKSVCKQCCVAYNLKWFRSDYKKDPAKRAAANRRCRLAKLDQYRATDRARQKRRGSRADAHREWSTRNREHVRKHKAASEHKRRAVRRGCDEHHSPSDIEALLIAQAGLCFYCFAVLADYHVDHFIPLSKGGGNTLSNLRIACPLCNMSKGPKLPWEWRPEMFKENSFCQTL